MTTAEALAVIDQWANCRCVLMRAPTDPCRCRCVPSEAGFGWRWECDGPVREPEELTARDRAERRKKRRGR